MGNGPRNKAMAGHLPGLFAPDFQGSPGRRITRALGKRIRSGHQGCALHMGKIKTTGMLESCTRRPSWRSGSKWCHGGTATARLAVNGRSLRVRCI